MPTEHMEGSLSNDDEVNRRYFFISIAEMNALKKLNLFESESTNVEIVRRERLATRLYISLLSLSMIGIILYAALSKRTIMITTLQPPEHHFHSLDAHYSDTLRCPCSRVSIQYSEFVQSQVAFHEVCGSSFITQEWLDAIYAANVSFLSPTDIRTTSSTFWQLIRSFCSLSNNILIDVENDIDATLLLTPTVQSLHLIETKVETSRRFCFTSAVTSLQLNMLISREMTLGNGLLSGLGTNAYFHTTDRWSQDSRRVGISPVTFDDGCSCTNSDGCLRPAVYYGTTVPGMMFDCLPLDGMLASSLECFYEPACLSLIRQLSFNALEPTTLEIPVVLHSMRHWKQWFWNLWSRSGQYPFYSLATMPDVVLVTAFTHTHADSTSSI